MRAVDAGSAAWLVLILLAVAYSATRGSTSTEARSERTRGTLAASATYALTQRGERGVADANGVVVPIRPYRRIASAGTLADDLLLALVEPERIVALSEYGRRHSDHSHLYGERMTIVGLHQIEPLLEQRVDLVVTNHVRSHSELARLRESGVAVFNLGEMRGLNTLLPNIHALAALLGAPERGERYAVKLVRRMRSVAADIPKTRRKRAMYVAAYANQLFGGGKGTSYHDVLEHAGLIDVAGERYSGWPHYDPEQILELDPELIVANAGTAEALCSIGGLAALRACQRGAVITVRTELLGDPGPRMLDAAEELRAEVYGEPERPLR